MPMTESVKEVLRLVVLFVGSWIVVQLLGQVNSVPSILNVNVWVFQFPLPVRESFIFVLTFAARFFDKWRYEHTKEQPKVETKGILPF